MRAFLFLSLTISLFADEFPKPFNTGTDVGKKPMSADEAVKLIKMPEGFKATVFAAEPDVQNPIACAWDSRGRLWVAENYSYAEAAVGFDKRLRDRIVIFEDTDNDGKHDKRTVFADNLFNLTSIELGYGGVYATAAPYLLWIPDEDRDDKPDAAVSPNKLYSAYPSYENTSTRILLDGFDDKSVRHNFVNGLRWGPDGWLYGRHGILATSKVGKPGTPDAERLGINVGIWRWHPTRHTVEMVTYGGTNPWGLDFNAEGEGFFTNTVTGHLYHMIPGAHYERMYGEDPNPYIYQLLPQTADHYHYDRSKSWTASRDGAANDHGGGHAHVGCMIYQGENWPEQYRGKLFTINLHGRRINVNRLERKGSGYVGKSEPDMIFFGDPWFRGNELTYGPDGGVYVLDWSDQGECHENDGVHRESGRIYKITYGDARKGALAKNAPDNLKTVVSAFESNGNLAGLADSDLVNVAVYGNEWASRIARRLMAERSLNDSPSISKSHLFLRSILEQKAPEDVRFKAFLTLYGSAGLRKRFTLQNNPDFAGTTFAEFRTDSNEGIRKASVYMDSETGIGPMPLESDPPGVILAFASSYCRKVAKGEKGDFASSIGRFLDGDSDPVLSTMVAYVAAQEIGKFKRLVVSYLPTESRILAYNLGRATAANYDALRNDIPLSLLKLNGRKAATIAFLDGLRTGLAGRINVVCPRDWNFKIPAQTDPELNTLLVELNIIFSGGRNIDSIRALALNSKAEISPRRQALESLVASKPADLRATLEKLVAEDRELMGAALRGMAVFDDAGPFIATNYQRLYREQRAMIVPVMCSRPAFALALLDAVAAGKIARSDITPYHARQIAGLADDAVNKRLAEIWGSVATTSDQKKKRMAELKAALTPEVLAKADIEKGRAVYTQTCAACHTLFDLGQTGANLGPNLTGSGRGDINYLLENIIDPSAIVPADYKLSTVTLKDGRVLSGFISSQNAQTMTLRTMTETQTLDRTTVAKTEASAQSLMPEGILDALTPDQIRDLFGFLMRK